jgi:hypothetical protein
MTAHLAAGVCGGPGTSIRLFEEATRVGLTIIHVDATLTVDDLGSQVMAAFGLSVRGR